MITEADFLFMIQPVNQPSSIHCNYFIQCTSESPQVYPSSVVIKCYHSDVIRCALHLVHTAVMYSYLQPPFCAHCSYTIQCTLQLHHTVHITPSAPLDHKRQMQQPNMLLVVCDSLNNPIDEEDWLFIAIQMMKKTS